MPPKYEYKTVVISQHDPDLRDAVARAETQLNSYGNDGWELVSAYCCGGFQHQYCFKRELQQEPQVDETEVTQKQLFSAMNELKVDAEPPSPTPGVFIYGTIASASEKPPDAGTEVVILLRDLDDLRNDFDRVRRKLCRNLGDGFITKEEQFEDFKRPNDFDALGGIGNNRRYPGSFKGMTSKDYRAWKSEFEAYHIQKQKNREIQREQEMSRGVPSLEEEQIAKDRLEAELQWVLEVEREAENKAKLKAYIEAEADAKAQKNHFLETGEFISKSE